LTEEDATHRGEGDGMTEELRTLLADELSAEQRPPLGDIIPAAMRDGRRMRRNRRFAAIGSGTAVAAVVVVAASLAGPAATGGVGTKIPAAAPPTVAQATASAPVPVAAEPHLVKATTRGMLELLTQIVPGKTSAPAAASDGSLAVQLNVDRGHGLGMVRVFVSGTGTTTGTVTVHADGLADNCIENRYVEAAWSGGTEVMVLVPSCLAWDGHQNKPAASSLSDTEAKALAADPRWGTKMNKALVDAGAQHFPALKSFS
jgi:hypothetical protein